jgi:thiol-disulfide isomerase/thioredoxin
MSQMRDSEDLREGRDRAAASRATHRHRRVPALLLPLLLGCLTEGCATTPRPSPESVDFVMPNGQRASLASFRGRVVIVDVCASWASACNLNARVLDEVAEALRDQPVEVVTLLLDEGPLAQEAQRSYVEVLGVRHLVVLAGSRVLAGTSLLGPGRDVPRLLVVDAKGRVAMDEVGGIVSVAGVVERVRPLLRSARR